MMNIHKFNLSILNTGDVCGDMYPHLQNDRFFTVKLEETFDVCTVRNDKHFIIINIITCASFVQCVISGFFQFD